VSDRLPGIRPRPTLWRRLDASARWSFPASSTAIVLTLTAAPLGWPAQAELQGAVALASVFFWSLFRPASMPPPVVFLLGLYSDLLDYAPPGVGVLTLLIVHGLALRWRRVLVRQGFLLVWLSFVGVVTGACVLQWMLSCVLVFRLLPPGPGAFQAALAAGIYPALAVVLTRAHQTLADPYRA
jgi:rod shape-determining protein MreD